MMYNELILAEEKENQRKSILISVVIHLLLLLICFLPYFYSTTQTDDQLSGILVQLGDMQPGNSEELAALSESEDAATESEDDTPEPQVEEEAAVKEEVTEAPAPTPAPEVVNAVVVDKAQEESDILAKKKQEKKNKEAEERKAKEAAIAAAKAKAEAEKKAAAEAKRKAEEEAAAKKAKYDAQKSKFGSLLSGGKGNANESGSEGSPDGDPNSTALDNLASGSGIMGEGLSDRAIEYTPTITDNSQKTGRVVVDICINAAGNVISAKFTQRGSTTSDKDLIDVAVKGVKKYRFSSSSAKKQCGSVIIDFKLK